MPPPDPSDGGGILGLLGRMGNPGALYQGNLADPATQQAIAGRGLLSLAGGFADAAMPSRMPIPFGAALGHAAAAMGQGEDAIMQARLQAAEAQQQLALGQLTQQKVGMIPQFQNAFQEYLQAGGGGTGSPTAPIIPPGTTTIPGTGPVPFGGGRGAMFTPEQISAAAIANHLDPELVNTVVGIESSHGANTSNKISPSNTGLFQMAPANAPGGMNDTPQNQLQIGINTLAKEKADLEAKLGRPASNSEVYLAHQQGVAGAVALLTNPAKPAGEVTRPINISNNGGNPNQPASVFTDYWNNRYAHFSAPYTNMTARPIQVASAGPVTGLLNPQPGAVPPLSPETKQFMRDKGMSEEAIARADGALSGPPPVMTPPGPPGPGAAAPPVGVPPPLVTPPGPPPTAPQITQLPQATAAPPQTAPPVGTPGGIQGAPSPARIRAAQQLNYLWPMVFGGQAPAEIAETASWDIKTAEAMRDAQIKYYSTAQRPSAVTPLPGGGYAIAPGAPSIIPGPPTAQGQPTSQIAYPMGSNQPPVQQPLGVTGASPKDVAAGTAAGTAASTLGPTSPMAPPPGAVPSAAAASPDKPRMTAFGVIPPLSEQKLPDSVEEAKSQIPQWTARVNDWTNRIPAAQQAEMRMTTLAEAFKSIQSGTWASDKAAIVAALDSLGIHLDPKTVNDPAAVQLTIHENILSTLPLLKEATSKPTQTEFAVTREAREGPNIQPAANLQMLAEDIAMLRQAQNLPNAFHASGWKNATQFEAAYLSANKLAPLADSIKQEIGQLRGMPGWVPPGAPPGTKAVLWPNGAPKMSGGKPVYEYPIVGPDGAVTRQQGTLP